jgi:hypothetical protein
LSAPVTFNSKKVFLQAEEGGGRGGGGGRKGFGEGGIFKEKFWDVIHKTFYELIIILIWDMNSILQK